MTTTLLSVLVFIMAAIGWSTPVSAHRSPDGCLGSGLAINLYANPNQVNVGDAVSYTLEVFNGSGGGPIVCNASGIQASLTTPDGQVHSISLTRTTLANGERDTYANAVTYIARAEDVHSGILAATANVSGNIHQNDTDSQGSGHQGVNTTVIAPPPTITTTTSITPPSNTPPTTSTGGGGGCAYGFNFDLMRCNYTPLPTPAPVAVLAVVPYLPITGFPPRKEITLIYAISHFIQMVTGYTW